VKLAAAALLVVDDNEDNRYTLSRRLAREGYTNVTTANDGRQALELLHSKTFDLVLLDIMMPDVNGYEMLEHLKADAELRHIPVIMISAVDDLASVVRCIELGAEDYLSKPFNATLLRARVGASLEKKALRDEVLAWNRTLEERVREQVSQLDRLGRLKGFFSPQLADLIVSGGGEDLLKTHRREVVVVFLDLRGFTVFTDSSEPEEVMRVLAEYHRVMGQLIMTHEGTLERFAGDGMMIFFNDPIKLDYPTTNAMRMALAMQEKFAPLRAAWKKGGYDLDLGIGIAQGYATLGAIGFDGRWDYACIGSVTNLAARLCSEANGGQILTNQKTLTMVEESAQVEPLGEITLEGISQPVRVFNVTGFSASEPRRPISDLRSVGTSPPQDYPLADGSESAACLSTPEGSRPWS
jgi:adenylate cyclase